MKTDIYGRQILSEDDLCNIYMKDPEKVIKHCLTLDSINFSSELELSNFPKISIYQPLSLTIEEFDILNQNNWLIPDNYKNFDIAKYVLDLCTNESELQRAGDELIKFQERDMFPLLRYCKYLVDTMREHNIVWGVGRGSSVASFVLFLIGIHRINSLYYDLPIEEFLK